MRDEEEDGRGVRTERDSEGGIRVCVEVRLTVSLVGSRNTIWSPKGRLFYQHQNSSFYRGVG